MTTERTKTDHNQDQSTARPGMLDTIIHLGAATTNLAIDQVGNAFTALLHPAEAIDHVKETLQNLSDAMNTSAASARTGASAGRSEERPASDLRGASDEMVYVSTEGIQKPVVEVRAHAGTPAARVRGVKINHRKG